MESDFLELIKVFDPEKADLFELRCAFRTAADWVRLAHDRLGREDVAEYYNAAISGPLLLALEKLAEALLIVVNKETKS